MRTISESRPHVPIVQTDSQAIQSAIGRLIAKENLSRNEIFGALEEIKRNRTAITQIGGFLVGLAMRRVSVEELAAIAERVCQSEIVVGSR